MPTKNAPLTGGPHSRPTHAAIAPQLQALRGGRRRSGAGAALRRGAAAMEAGAGGGGRRPRRAEARGRGTARAADSLGGEEAQLLDLSEEAEERPHLLGAGAGGDVGDLDHVGAARGHRAGATNTSGGGGGGKSASRPEQPPAAPSGPGGPPADRGLAQKLRRAARPPHQPAWAAVSHNAPPPPPRRRSARAPPTHAASRHGAPAAAHARVPCPSREGAGTAPAQPSGESRSASAHARWAPRGARDAWHMRRAGMGLAAAVGREAFGLVCVCSGRRSGSEDFSGAAEPRASSAHHPDSSQSLRGRTGVRASARAGPAR